MPSQTPPTAQQQLGSLAECPKCGFSLPAPDASCPKCGIVFAHWRTPMQKPWLGKYIYKMVPAAEHIIAEEEKLKGNEAALYLERLVNDLASKGWEFYRIDEMAMSVSSPALFGTRSQSQAIRMHIITFRREVGSSGG